LDYATSKCFHSDRLIVGFQKEFRKIVSYSDDIELENFCALSNSNVKFISLCREFLENCQETSGVPLDELQKAFQSSFVNKSFTEISNTSYFRLQELVKDQVATWFLSIKDYKTVLIVIILVTLAKVYRGSIYELEAHLREAVPELLQETVEVHSRRIDQPVYPDAVDMQSQV
jgi:hypothetical protein